MKYKITVLSKNPITKSTLADAAGLFKTIGETFKCEFEVIYKSLTKKEDLSIDELTEIKGSDAVILETESQAMLRNTDSVKSQLAGSTAYTLTEYGAVFETVSLADDDGAEQIDQKNVDSLLSVAQVLDYLKLNDAARLLRQGIDQLKKTGGAIQGSGEKIGESVSNFIKSSLANANPKKLQAAYDEMLLSFGGVIEI